MCKEIWQRKVADNTGRPESEKSPQNNLIKIIRLSYHTDFHLFATFLQQLRRLALCTKGGQKQTKMCSNSQKHLLLYVVRKLPVMCEENIPVSCQKEDD